MSISLRSGLTCTFVFAKTDVINPPRDFCAHDDVADVEGHLQIVEDPSTCYDIPNALKFGSKTSEGQLFAARCINKKDLFSEQIYSFTNSYQTEVTMYMARLPPDEQPQNAQIVACGLSHRDAAVYATN